MVRRRSPVVEGLEQRALLSGLSLNLTTDQSVYQLGQPIELSFTETNSSDQPVTVPRDQPAGFNITHDGELVMIDALPQIVVSGTQTFQPGQTVTIPQTWNGIPMSGPYTIANLTGIFVVGYGPEGNPDQYTTTFQIAAPSPLNLVTSVATDQTTYADGQPVNLTFTESNNGDQPVAVLTGPVAFEIAQNGTVLWGSTNVSELPSSTAWEMLQPGQSYTQTTTWDGFDGYAINSPEGTGTFTVSNLLDPAASTANFQILGTPYPPVSNPGPAAPIPIANPVPITVTLSTQHATYVVGQSVPITVVLDNVSANKVKIKPHQSIVTVTVHHGSTVVYESARKVLASGPATIKPGRPLRLIALWSGKANHAGIKKLAPGRYTITINDDGYEASTAVQLVSRRHQAATDVSRPIGGHIRLVSAL